MLHFRSKKEIEKLEFYDDPRFQGYSAEPPSGPIVKVLVGDLPGLIGAFDVGSSIGLEKLRIKFHYVSEGHAIHDAPTYWLDYHLSEGDVIPPRVAAKHNYHYPPLREVNAEHDFVRSEFLLLIPVFDYGLAPPAASGPPRPPGATLNYGEALNFDYFKTYPTAVERIADMTNIQADEGRLAFQKDDPTAAWELVKATVTDPPTVPPKAAEWKRIFPNPKLQAELNAVFAMEMNVTGFLSRPTMTFVNVAYEAGQFTNSDKAIGALTLRTIATALPKIVKPPTTVYKEKIGRVYDPKLQPGSIPPEPGEEPVLHFVNFAGAMVQFFVADDHWNNPVLIVGGTGKSYPRQYSPGWPWMNVPPITPPRQASNEVRMDIGYAVPVGIGFPSFRWNSLDVDPTPHYSSTGTLDAYFFTPVTVGIEERQPSVDYPDYGGRWHEPVPPVVLTEEYTDPFPATKYEYYPHMSYAEAVAREFNEGPGRYDTLNIPGPDGKSFWDLIPYFRDVSGPNDGWVFRVFFNDPSQALYACYVLPGPPYLIVALPIAIEDESVWTPGADPMDPVLSPISEFNLYPYPHWLGYHLDVKFDTTKTKAAYKRDSFLT